MYPGLRLKYCGRRGSIVRETIGGSGYILLMNHADDEEEEEDTFLVCLLLFFV